MNSLTPINIMRFTQFPALLAVGWLLLGLAGCKHAVEEIPAPENAVESVRGESEPVSLPPITPTENDWPWWRGIHQDNHATGLQPPTTWTETENVLWKSAVPGKGHATPILWGEKIFVSTAEEQGEKQSLVCFDRASGEQLWQTVIHAGQFPRVHPKNSQASASPACDGERVFTVFALRDATWVTAVDLDGTILWQTEAGPFKATHGYGSSPVLYQDYVIVMADNKNGGFVAALHRASGKIIWRVRREMDDSYSTPIIAHVAGKDQLLITGQSLVISYNPLTGEEYWRCRGPAQTCANSMAYKENIVFATGGYPEQNLMAIRADGSGDVSSSHILWEDSFKLYVPSPLVVEDRLLAMGDSGVCQCYSIANGEVLWKKRMGGGFSASPVLVGDLVYCPDEKGSVRVFHATDQAYETVANNELGDGGMASPVIVGGKIYLRTASSLYCIGTPDETQATDQPDGTSAN